MQSSVWHLEAAWCKYWLLLFQQSLGVWTRLGDKQFQGNFSTEGWGLRL